MKKQEFHSTVNQYVGDIQTWNKERDFYAQLIGNCQQKWVTNKLEQTRVKFEKQINSEMDKLVKAVNNFKVKLHKQSAVALGKLQHVVTNQFFFRTEFARQAEKLADQTGKHCQDVVAHPEDYRRGFDLINFYKENNIKQRMEEFKAKFKSFEERNSQYFQRQFNKLKFETKDIDFGEWYKIDLPDF